MATNDQVEFKRFHSRCFFHLHFFDFKVLFLEETCFSLLKKITCCAKREEITYPKEKSSHPPPWISNGPSLSEQLIEDDTDLFDLFFLVPNKPGSVTISSNQETNLTVTWTAPEAGTVFNKYKVCRDPGNVCKEHEKTVTLDILLSLTANTEYTITVKTISRHSESLIRESTADPKTAWTRKIFINQIDIQLIELKVLIQNAKKA